jgi:hypothetical protein
MRGSEPLRQDRLALSINQARQLDFMSCTEQVCLAQNTRRGPISVFTYQQSTTPIFLGRETARPKFLNRTITDQWEQIDDDALSVIGCTKGWMMRDRIDDIRETIERCRRLAKSTSDAGRYRAPPHGR